MAEGPSASAGAGGTFDDLDGGVFGDPAPANGSGRTLKDIKKGKGVDYEPYKPKPKLYTPSVSNTPGDARQREFGMACFQDRLDDAKALFVSRVDVNGYFHLGLAQKQVTPLIAAAGEGNVGCVAWLLEVGADPNQVDEDGATALYVACKQKHARVVDLLVTHDADSAITRKGKTALDVAEENGFADEPGMRDKLYHAMGNHGAGEPTKRPPRTTAPPAAFYATTVRSGDPTVPIVKAEEPESSCDTDCSDSDAESEDDPEGGYYDDDDAEARAPTSEPATWSCWSRTCW